jgi:hypothetical protein
MCFSRFARIVSAAIAVAALAAAPCRGRSEDRLHRSALGRGGERRGERPEAHRLLYRPDQRAGGLNGEKIEVLSYDNKVSPQESLIMLKKAIDEGARIIMQGNGSSVAHALTDAVLKHNERNPARKCCTSTTPPSTPALTNEKCHFWHFASTPTST